MRLAGKVAIVTGSSRGLGKAIALELAGEGADIVVVARTETQGPVGGTIYDTAKEIEALGRRALSVRTDVTKEEDIQNMVKRAVAEFGRVDILVNNVGLSALRVPIVDLPIKRWDLVTSLNLRAPFICVKAVLPKMIEQMSGSIINVSSILGTRVIKGDIPYGVTKAALERFTLGLAEELKKYNISVNAIAPSLTDTAGIRFRFPDVNRTGWQRPEFWGNVVAFIVGQGPAFTGRIVYEDDFWWEQWG